MTAQAIRIVERSALAPGVFPVGRTARAVEADLHRINEALGRRGFSGRLTIPTQEAIAGQVSNVRAWLYNESRRAKETIVEITQGAATKSQVMSWLARGGLRRNRNTFDLAVGTHIRSTARLGMWEFIEATRTAADPITHLGVIVPRQSEGNVRPQGVLQRYLGRVFAVDKWLNVTRESNKQGRTGLSLAFSLGLHHNDPHQLVPVTAAKLEAVRQIMRRYRERLLRKIRKDRGG